MQVFSELFNNYFSNKQAVILTLFLALIFTGVLTLGEMLGPFLAAIVIAYLLNSPTDMLEKRGLPRVIASTIVFLLFLALLMIFSLGLLPLLSTQISQFISELPGMVAQGQKLLLELPSQYPDLVKEGHVLEISKTIRQSLTELTQGVLSQSLRYLPGLITLLIYLILVPLLVFFMLKDKATIVNWSISFLPKDNSLVLEVWQEVDQQIGNYVRGKVWEVFIVGIVTYMSLKIFGLHYAELLATVVGLSVLVPFVGIVVVTIPVALIGFFQFGWGSEFGYLMLAYGIVQILDGNVLVPLLFSEVVNLHPIAIIVAVLLFGGLWGFWGVFFAIPLATLVKAVISAWPN